MAKLLDKLYNRVIDGKLVIEPEDEVSKKSPKKILLPESADFAEFITEHISELNAGDIVIEGNYQSHLLSMVTENTVTVIYLADDGFYNEVFSRESSEDTFELDVEHSSGPILFNDFYTGCLFNSGENAGKLLEVKSNGRIEASDVIKVKTLEQTEANFELDLGDAIEALSDTDVEFTNIYSKLLVINNVLYIVINYKAKALNAGTYAKVLTISNIPKIFGDKVYDMQGKKLSESVTYTASITVLFGAMSNDGQSSWSAITNSFFNHSGEDTIMVYLGGLGPMAQDAEKYVTLRNFVTLLPLSTNE